MQQKDRPIQTDLRETENLDERTNEEIDQP